MGDGSSSPASVTSFTSDLSANDIDAPIHSLRYKRTLNQENLSRESMSTEWTNEKHSMYLMSMEASFVNDLYTSFDLKRKHSAACAPLDQILQSGNWEKLDFESNGKGQTEKVDGLGVLLENPWIRHFRSSRRCQIVTSLHLQENVELAADVSSCDIVEVSDQNFADEKVIGDKTSFARYPKRIKTRFL